MAKDSFQQEEAPEFRVWLNAFVLIVGLGSAAFFGVALFRSTLIPTADSAVPDAVLVQENPFSSNTPEAISEGVVLGESDIALPGALKSENYTLGQVALGGDATLVSSDSQEIGPLEISGVRGEAFMDKGKKDVNILVTWKTTKLSSAVITYGKNGADTSKTFQEDGYGLNHSVILPGLDQSSTYIYTVAAKDRFGNEATSDSYAVYTGTKTASLFDLISGAVTDTFGWAMKK